VLLGFSVLRVMSTTGLAMPRFLAIDDHAGSAELLARIATRNGYEAKAITDTSLLADLIVNWRPQVIGLDLDMPILDGPAVITLLGGMGFSGDLLIVSGMKGNHRHAACELAERLGVRVAAEARKPVDIKAVGYILAALRFGSPQPSATDVIAASSV
jgi:CheY-like chemotaxis protein